MFSLARLGTVAGLFLLAQAAPAPLRRDVSSSLLNNLDLLAQYSAAAYCSENLNSTGTKLTCSVGNCPLVEAASTQTLDEFNESSSYGNPAGYLAADETNKLLVLSFRGSSDLANWVANLNFGLEDASDLCSGCEVHSGFWKAWSEIADTITSKVESALSDHSDYSLVLTGHSYGAALAALAATALRNSGHSVELYNYGQPRLGNEALATYITDQNKGGNYRVTHTNDIVPKLPPTLLGYHHFSPEYYISSADEATVTTTDVTEVMGIDATGGNDGTDGTSIDAHRCCNRAKITGDSGSHIPTSNAQEPKIYNMKVRTLEYEPLPTPTSIRVVTLLHGESDITVFGVPLIPLSIQVVDLNDNPRFQALSYTWGSPFPPDLERSKGYGPNNKFPVAINGQISFLTRNLFEFLQRLKTEELNVDRRTKPYNKTRLIEAAEAGSENDVYFWMARGADLAAQDMFGETALHYAAENGYFEVVKILVEAGSDVHRRDSSRRTPLDCAKMRKRRKYAEVIEYLERPDIHHIVGNDIAERNAQVAIMSMIYTKSSGVFVWLGVDDESTMRAVEATHLPSQEGMDMWYNDVLNNHIMEDPETRVAKQGSNEAALKYQAVVNLFRRTWFQRVWIIQEIALAKQIRIFCGRVEFEYHKLFTLFHNPNFTSRVTSRSMAQALELARWKGIGGSELSTLTDIRLRTSKHVFERRVMDEYVKKNDISLVATWDQKLSLSLLANYSKSTSEVFIQFARIYMQGAPDEPLQTWHTGECEVFECLEGLSFVQESPDVSRIFDGQKLPSWIPNFTAPLITTRLWSPRFRAGVSPDTPPVILPDDDVHTLLLNGIFHDEIVSVEPQIGTSTATSFRPPNWLELISTMDKAYLPTGENRVEALWRTLMTNKLSSTSENPVQDARSSFRFFIQKALWSLTHKSDKDTITNLNLIRETNENDTLPTWEEVQQYGEKDEVGKPRGRVRIDDRDFDQTFVHFYRGRLLYRTKRGYLGLGPWSVQPGDEYMMGELLSPPGVGTSVKFQNLYESTQA
ncbi:hypothetical protein BDV33DRAFT_233451 [Aspergillus novoparasiticus]|uniref:feruloyl esterase n=1 Tax=Aspergillus novoparasiticus TaxID=986946 RepID=A0A5N6F3Y0_9EURO|nr:hypothetical protein BDV33DRAFT_233451 [Aspergillus novoparasiticus]